MRRLNNPFYTIIGIVAVALIVYVLFVKGSAIYKYSKNGGTLYRIEAGSYRDTRTYLTNEFKKDSISGCITFKDEFNIKRTVCNNFTITEF